eukprot:9064104-Pyramimonas_sp.AAC.1
MVGGAQKTEACPRPTAESRWGTNGSNMALPHRASLPPVRAHLHVPGWHKQPPRAAEPPDGWQKKQAADLPAFTI